jgi:hypothetical protein
MQTNTQKLMISFVNKESIIIALTVFFSISTVNFLYAQDLANSASPLANVGSDWSDAIVKETLAIMGSILALGISALVQWMRSKGIPVTDQQEAMFRDIVTDRFSKLAKDSWTTMRDHPENLNIYWDELRQGHIPQEFQEELRTQGYEFAMKLKENKEFRDFAKNIRVFNAKTSKGLEDQPQERLSKGNFRCHSKNCIYSSGFCI